MDELITQLAFDANISPDIIAGRNQELELLQRTNLAVDGALQFEHEGYGMNLAPKSQKNGIFIADSRAEFKAAAMALDDAIFSAPSNGVLPYFTTLFNKDPIKQVLKTTPSRMVSEDWQQGQFGTTDIKIPTLSYLGQSELYSDEGGQGESSVNMNWIPRNTVTLQRTVKYGDLEVAQNAMAKMDIVGNLRTGLTSLTNLDINYINLFGFSGRQVYGFLNDPSLAATIQFPNNAANTSSLWINKTFDEILADVRSMWNGIIANAGGNCDYSAEAFLMIPPSAYIAITTPNTYGITIAQELTVIFPKMKLVQCAQYQGTGSPAGSAIESKCQLMLKEVNGKAVVNNIFSSLYNSHGVVRMLSYYAEKVSYTVSGGFIAYPFAVSTGEGL